MSGNSGLACALSAQQFANNANVGPINRYSKLAIALLPVSIFFTVLSKFANRLLRKILTH
jgi:hypothetical protein